jgi:hypothetical protein
MNTLLEELRGNKEFDLGHGRRVMDIAWIEADPDINREDSERFTQQSSRQVS